MWTTSAPLGDAAQYWDQLFQEWIVPAGRLAGPLLIIFAGLFIIASVATRAVPIGVRMWPRPSSWIFVTGVLVILAASAVPTVVMPMRNWPRTFGNWGLAGALALAGIVLVAFGMATRLRLRVDVRDAAGQPDLSAADYVLARLERLGADRPRGLHHPQQTDVMGLPDNAVETLPEGKVLSALFKLVYTIIPLMPWRATAAWLDEDRLSVTLSRNGRLINATVVSRSVLGLPASEKRKADAGATSSPVRAELLTGAAAFVLLELADKVTALKRGLCGASRWESLTLQVLATDPKPEPAPEADLRFLATAVDRDPFNGLAKFAYLVNRCGYTSVAAEQKQLATAMRDMHLRLMQGGEVEKGSEALEMRVLFAEGAAWLNAHLLESDESAFRAARTASKTLLQLCERHKNKKKIKGFVAEMGLSAGFLWQCVTVSAKPPRPSNPDIGGIATEWTDKHELSLQAHYDRACQRVAKDDPDLEGALRDLHLALALESLRRWAVEDPSLVVLRADDRFWRAAGQPRVKVFTDLGLVKPHVKKLAGAGIHTARQLGDRTESGADRIELGVYLGVAVQEVVRLHGLARMSTCAPGLAAHLEWVDLLVAVGVDSPDELQHQLGNDLAGLHQKLHDLAEKRGMQPPGPEELATWKSPPSVPTDNGHAELAGSVPAPD